MFRTHESSGVSENRFVLREFLFLRKRRLVFTLLSQTECCHRLPLSFPLVLLSFSLSISLSLFCLPLRRTLWFLKASPVRSLRDRLDMQTASSALISLLLWTSSHHDINNKWQKQTASDDLTSEAGILCIIWKL